jgi:hypothetical protein
LIPVGTGIVGHGIRRQANGEHMVRPHDKTEETNGRHSEHHAQITKDRFAGEGSHHFADHTESWQDQDVYFRMAEEPEQMLEQHWIAAACRIKETRAEITVGQQHGDSTSKYRHRQQQQESSDKDSPRK